MRCLGRKVWRTNEKRAVVELHSLGSYTCDFEQPLKQPTLDPESNSPRPTCDRSNSKWLQYVEQDERTQRPQRPSLTLTGFLISIQACLPRLTYVGLH